MSLRSITTCCSGKNARTTPKELHPPEKLERVYSTLMDPVQNIQNITAIALDYLHPPGALLRIYKAAYGVLPSESLRQQQSG